MPKLPDKRYISIQAAAAYAGLAEKTIRRRVADGTLTGYRMGTRIIRVDLVEIDALLVPIPTVAKSA